MRAFIFSAIFLLSVHKAWGQEAFVYNDHGKRDPFLPVVSSEGAVIVYDGEMTSSDLSLEGVVIDPQGDSVAIINGKIMKQQQSIGGYVIDLITQDHVELSKGSEKSVLKLKKGGM